MANEIRKKISAASALTITLASLATSVANVGRQATEVTLSGSPTELTINYSIKQGTTPTGNKAVYFYILWSDGTHRDGVVGATDAGFTIPPNILPCHVAANKSSPATGDVIKGSFTVPVCNSRFVLALYHDTAVNLDSTGGNHYVQYVTLLPEVQ